MPSRPTRRLGSDRVRPGDVVVAMALLRPALERVLAGPARSALDGAACGWMPRSSRARPATLGEELLEPTRIYAQACLTLIAEGDRAPRHAFSHVTGGPGSRNLERVLPLNPTATLDRTTWSLPPCLRPRRRDRRGARRRPQRA